MEKRRLAVVVVAVLLAAASGPAVQAQTVRRIQLCQGPSHIAVPLHGPTEGQFADFLKRRDPNRELAEAFDKYREIAADPAKYFNPKQIEELKRLGLLDESGKAPDWSDPRAPKFLERLLENQERLKDRFPEFERGGGLTTDPKVLEGFQRALEEAKDGKGLPSAPEQSRSPAALPTTTGNAEPIAPAAPVEPPAASPPANQEGMRQTLHTIVEQLSETPLGESSTLRRLGRQLSHSMLNGESQGNGAGTNWLGKLPRLPESFSLRRWLPHGLPSLRGPSWAHVGPPTVGAPNVMGIDTPGSGNVLIVVWLIVGAVLVVLIWKVQAARRNRVADSPPAWQLGAWPVNPAEVTSRQDIIRAFEYLSLMLLGPAAKAWNHHEIATRLGLQQAETVNRQLAAQHLAALYEQARYAPAAESLLEEELLAARRELCLLAGVASA
jgi:hypothetical protein